MQFFTVVLKRFYEAGVPLFSSPDSGFAQENNPETEQKKAIILGSGEVDQEKKAAKALGRPTI